MADGNRSLDEVIGGFRAMTSMLNPQQTQFQPATYTPPLFIPPTNPALNLATAGAPSPYFNMASAQQLQVSPYAASVGQSVMGQPPMSFPSPQMFTSANMGIYRNLPQPGGFHAAMPSSSSMPSFAAPITPPMPSLSFGNSMDMRSRFASEDSRRYAAQDLVGMQAGARGLASAAGSWVGTGIGAVAGGMLGGASGANWGSMAGGVAGSMAGFMPGVAAATQWAFEPALRLQAQSMRMREASEQWHTGGSQLSPTGRGMAPTAATQMTSRLGGLASSIEGFNRTDIINMTQMAGQAGIMNMTQSTDQTVEAMKSVVKLVGAVAKMTGDPDMRAALSHIANLRQGGLGFNQSLGAMHNMNAFARMAGTDINGIMSQGAAQGGAIFQAGGLTAGTGMMVGGFSQAMARANTASGAFTPQQLALYGGESGVAQSMTQGIQGMLTGQPGQYMLASIVKMGPGGNLMIDQDKLKSRLNSNFTISGLARDAAANMSDPAMIQRMHTQMPELIDQMGQSLKGAGGLLLAGKMIRAVKQDMGPLATDESAAMGVYGDRNVAEQTVKQLRDRQGMNNMIQQTEIEARRVMVDNQRTIQDVHGNVVTRAFGRGSRSFDRKFDAINPLRGTFNSMALSAAEQEEDAIAEAQGMDVQRSPLIGAGPESQQYVSKLLTQGYGRREGSSGLDSTNAYLMNLGSKKMRQLGFGDTEVARRRLQGRFFTGNMTGGVMDMMDGLDMRGDRNMSAAARRAGGIGDALERGIRAGQAGGVEDYQKLFSGVQSELNEIDLGGFAANLGENLLDLSNSATGVGTVSSDDIEITMIENALNQMPRAKADYVRAKIRKNPELRKQLISVGATVASSLTSGAQSVGALSTDFSQRQAGASVSRNKVDFKTRSREITGKAGNLSAELGLTTGLLGTTFGDEDARDVQKMSNILMRLGGNSDALTALLAGEGSTTYTELTKSKEVQDALKAYENNRTGEEKDFVERARLGVLSQTTKGTTGSRSGISIGSVMSQSDTKNFISSKVESIKEIVAAAGDVAVRKNVSNKLAGTGDANIDTTDAKEMANAILRNEKAFTTDEIAAAKKFKSSGEEDPFIGALASAGGDLSRVTSAGVDTIVSGATNLSQDPNIRDMVQIRDEFSVVAEAQTKAAAALQEAGDLLIGFAKPISAALRERGLGGLAEDADDGLGPRFGRWLLSGRK